MHMSAPVQRLSCAVQAMVMQAEQDVNMVPDDLPSLSEIDADISTVRQAVAAAEAEEERFATEARRQQGFGSEAPSRRSGAQCYCVWGSLSLPASCCVTGASQRYSSRVELFLLFWGQSPAASLPAVG